MITNEEEDSVGEGGRANIGQQRPTVSELWMEKRNKKKEKEKGKYTSVIIEGKRLRHLRHLHAHGSPWNETGGNSATHEIPDHDGCVSHWARRFLSRCSTMSQWMRIDCSQTWLHQPGVQLP